MFFASPPHLLCVLHRWFLICLLLLVLDTDGLVSSRVTGSEIPQSRILEFGVASSFCSSYHISHPCLLCRVCHESKLLVAFVQPEVVFYAI
jgi:hypothetical protein